MSEKKWFIYVQDHHEGPFTVDEIWEGINQGRYTHAGFVWTDGMKDWVSMSTLPDFDRRPTEVPPVAPPEPKVEARPITPEPIQTDAKTSVIEIASLESATQPQILRPAVLGAASATRPSTQGPGEKAPIITSRMKPFLFAVVVVFVLVGLQKTGFLHPFEDRLASILSTLPELSDVNPEDYDELKKAAKAPMSGGPQIAVALSKADPLSPIFYVSTNLPDGAKFEIYVEGVSDRLLNTLSYSGKLDVVTAKRLAKSSPLRYPDGKPIPRGEYFVYVMEAPVGQPDLVYKELLTLAPIARNLPNLLPQDRRLVSSKKIFFGAKDATYEQRLKEFHEGLVTRAKNETLELSQALATMESQALVLTSTYDRLKYQPIGPKQKQVWNEMNRTWIPVEKQITQKYEGLPPEKLKESFFHANLVVAFLEIEKILGELHATQEKLFTSSANAKALEPAVSDLQTRFNERKAAWKIAIERAVATPSNPETGLPMAVTIESEKKQND